VSKPRPMSASEAGLVASVIEAIESLEWNARQAEGASDTAALDAMHRARAEMYEVDAALNRAIKALETERPEDEAKS
jgi:hypothetical protein